MISGRGIKRICPAITLVLLVVFFMGGAGQAKAFVPDRAPEYHDPLDSWRVRHRFLVTGPERYFNQGECLICHDPKNFCNDCHGYVGTRPVQGEAVVYSSSLEYGPERCDQCHLEADIQEDDLALAASGPIRQSGRHPCPGIRRTSREVYLTERRLFDLGPKARGANGPEREAYEDLARQYLELSASPGIDDSRLKAVRKGLDQEVFRSLAAPSPILGLAILGGGLLFVLILFIFRVRPVKTRARQRRSIRAREAEDFFITRLPKKVREVRLS